MDIRLLSKKIEKEYEYSTIDFSGLKSNEIAIYIMMYEVEDFSIVFKQLSRLIKKGVEKNTLINEYIFAFKCLKRTITKFRNYIKNNKTVIKINESTDINKFISISPIFNKEDSLNVNLKNILVNALSNQLKKYNEMIFLYESFPQYFLNENINVLDVNSRLRWESEILIYKDVYISHIGHHRFGIHSNQLTTFESLNTIINIFSYLNCRPVFIETNNSNYNQKLSNVYSEFDILDMIKLRSNKFFGKGLNEAIYMEPTIFKLNKRFKHTILPDCNHEGLLDLYQSALKQIEPLPRCVFLYRIIEYGIAKHYQPTFRPSDNNPKFAIDYYIQQALNFKFIPIYFIDYGYSSNYKENKFIKKRKIAMRDFTRILKKQTEKIIEEWQADSYLGNKSNGEIIYITGRNRVAHGGNGQYNSRYDYSKNYLHINNVNILLELISRYLIEILYPEIVDLIEKRRHLYVLNSVDKRLFEEEKVANKGSYAIAAVPASAGKEIVNLK